LLGPVSLVLVSLALAACGKHEPAAPVDEEAELFKNACARCHGPEGTGGPPDMLGNPGPKNFTDVAFQSAITDAQIHGAIENGNRGMPSFGPVLTPRQIDLMVRHVRKLGAAAVDGSPGHPASAP
jgi:mono/diheme cytochrome c family protein